MHDTICIVFTLFDKKISSAATAGSGKYREQLGITKRGPSRVRYYFYFAVLQDKGADIPKTYSALIGPFSSYFVQTGAPGACPRIDHD